MKKLLLALFVCLSILPIPSTFAFNPTVPSVAAWLPSWDFDKGKKTIETYPALFSEISPFWYYLNDDGSIGVSTGGENADFVTELHQLGIRVIPSITNSFSDDRATAVMADPNKRTDFVKKISSLVTKQNYDGIDIDLKG